MDFTKLSFGAPAAERDKALSDYFIESDAYSQMASGTKRIIVGSRGAGKSAILRTIAERERLAGSVVVELAPEDYSYQMFNETLLKEQEGSWAKSGAYAAAWKYMIIVLIMKRLSKLHRGKKNSREEKRLFNYLSANHADVAEKPIDMLLAYLRRMEGVKVGKYEAGLKVRELTRLYKLEELEPYIPAMLRLARRTRVSVLVDELDQGWDGSEDAQAFVSGLFQACTSINRLAPERVRVFISLRQELYENIPAIYDDAQKYRDLFQSIRWSHDQLFRLLTLRIRHFLPAMRNKADRACWFAVFGELRSFRYMLERSQYRPRELITYATEAIDYVRANRRVIPVTHESVQAVEQIYSRDRYHDVVAEFRFQYPGLDSVINHFRGGNVTWTRERLGELLIELSVGTLPVDPGAKPWVEGSEPDHLLDILWRVGFLRIEKDRESSETDVALDWVTGTTGDPAASIVNAQHFSVHPLFHRALGLRGK